MSNPKGEGAMDLVAPEGAPDNTAPKDDPNLVQDLAALFDKHLLLQPGDSVVLALWALFTHTHDCHTHSPRLVLWSPSYGCGKTTVLDLLSSLVHRPFGSANPSEAVLFRVAENWGSPTMLLDEADTWLKNEKSSLNGILNSGFGPRPLAFVARVNLDKEGAVEKHSTWTPIAIATRLRDVDGGLVRRSIKVEMHKAPVGWESPPLNHVAIKGIEDRCKVWASNVDRKLRGARPALPPSLVNRDTWRPLFAIAELFGDGVVESLEKTALRKDGALEREDNVQLLLDIRGIFEQSGKARLHSIFLVERLVELEDRQWAERLARLEGDQSKTKWLSAQLKAFGITPTGTPWSNNIRRARGYERAAFVEVWKRYGVKGEETPGAAPLAA